MHRSSAGTICLDARSFGLPNGTGVASYARNLAAGLTANGQMAGLLVDGIAGASPPGRMRRWLRAAWPGCIEAFRDSQAIETDTWTAHDVFRRAQVHFDMHRDLLNISSDHPPALMHWTYPVPLVFRGLPNIYTIHDIIPWRHPDLTGIARDRFTRIIRRIAQQAAHIVTVSEASRREILECLDLPESFVTNTFQPVQCHADPDRAPPLRVGHFLFYGVIEPRKNLGNLIAAHHASGVRNPLILAGPDGWRAAEELAAGGRPIRLLTEMPLDADGGVWRAPWLPREDLMDLLRGARALVFPSLAEGFGLPIVEAMTMGAPVLTSSGGATEEIAGGAALLVDPFDTARMARALEVLSMDDALCGRLAVAGRIRAEAFSMQAYLVRLSSVYDRFLETRL